MKMIKSWAKLQRSIIEVESVVRTALEDYLSKSQETLDDEWKEIASESLREFLLLFREHLLLYCSLWGLQKAFVELSNQRYPKQESKAAARKYKNRQLECASRLYLGWDQVYGGGRYSDDDPKFSDIPPTWPSGRSVTGGTTGLSFCDLFRPQDRPNSRIVPFLAACKSRQASGMTETGISSMWRSVLRRSEAVSLAMDAMEDFKEEAYKTFRQSLGYLLPRTTSFSFAGESILEDGPNRTDLAREMIPSARTGFSFPTLPTGWFDDEWINYLWKGSETPEEDLTVEEFWVSLYLPPAPLYEEGETVDLVKKLDVKPSSKRRVIQDSPSYGGGGSGGDGSRGDGSGGDSSGGDGFGKDEHLELERIVDSPMEPKSKKRDLKNSPSRYGSKGNEEKSKSHDNKMYELILGDGDEHTWRPVQYSSCYEGGGSEGGGSEGGGSEGDGVGGDGSCEESRKRDLKNSPSRYGSKGSEEKSKSHDNKMYELTLDDDAYAPKSPPYDAVAGFFDVKRTCWLQSFIVSLAHCRSVWARFRKDDHLTNCIEKHPRNCTWCAVIIMLARAISSDEPLDSAYLEDFNDVGLCGSICTYFNTNEHDMHDPFEVLLALADLSKEFCKVFQFSQVDHLKCKSCDWSLTRKSTDNCVHLCCVKPEDLRKPTVAEYCDRWDHKKRSLQARKMQLSPLNDYLGKSFLHWQTVYDDRCHTCGETNSTVRVSKLETIPDVFCIRINRIDESINMRNMRCREDAKAFSIYEHHLLQNNGVVKAHLPFEEHLDLSSIVSGLAKCVGGSDDLKLRLSSVIHFDGKNHFSNYVRGLSSDKWWKVSDEEVVESSLEETLSSTAYMLFYEKETAGEPSTFYPEFVREVRDTYGRHVRGL